MPKFSTSRFLSRILRHQPEEIGLQLDPAGWAGIGEVLRLGRRAGFPISRESLLEAVATNDKRRFTLSKDGLRIRAAQGHSIPVELGLGPEQPPDTLFHGTARSSLDAIFRDGLLPMGRQLVHLSADPETAERVGSRHGRAVILRVMSGSLHQGGHPFYRADNGVWLTSTVPPSALSFATS